MLLGGLEVWILPILFVGQLGSWEPGALPWECWVLAVSWQSRPPSLFWGPCTDGHSLVNWKNAYHCLAQRAPLLPPPPLPPPPPPHRPPFYQPATQLPLQPSPLPPPLPHFGASLPNLLLLKSCVRVPPPPVLFGALKELYYWPPLSVTAPTDRLLKAQLYVSIQHALKAPHRWDGSSDSTRRAQAFHEMF